MTLFFILDLKIADLLMIIIIVVTDQSFHFPLDKIIACWLMENREKTIYKSP